MEYQDQRGHKLVGKEFWIDNSKYSAGSVRKVKVKLVFDDIALVIDCNGTKEELVHTYELYENPDFLDKVDSNLKFTSSVINADSVQFSIGKNNFSLSIDSHEKKCLLRDPKIVYKMIAQRIIAVEIAMDNGNIIFYKRADQSGYMNNWFEFPNTIKHKGSAEGIKARDVFFKVLKDLNIEIY
jgi:hypothetical protein